MGLFQEPTLPVRSPEALLESAIAVIDDGFAAGARTMLPLFSGGHDSLTVCHVASQHRNFPGTINHIDTHIGAKATRVFVESVCREYGWTLKVWRSPFTYERFVSRLGFPGPGSHSWAYQNLKDRCVSQMTSGLGKVALVTGCRREESTRRMGHVEPVVVGEWSKNKKKFARKNRVWLSSCFDWTVSEQRAYMVHHGLPTNPLKVRLGMSGECFCGAFASPGELERIRCHAPDVAAEIDRLAELAKANGKHHVWGTRPDKSKGLVVAQTGRMCSSCDRRAYAAGLLFKE